MIIIHIESEKQIKWLKELLMIIINFLTAAQNEFPLLDIFCVCSEHIDFWLHSD